MFVLLSADSTGRVGGAAGGSGRLSQHHRQSVRRRGHAPERKPIRTLTRPIPKQSVILLANASVPRHRSISVGMGAGQLSNLGSTLFASTVGGIGSGGTAAAAAATTTSVEELADTAPVIVELPHESISVEDYARPLYRKDIFFP